MNPEVAAKIEQVARETLGVRNRLAKLIVAECGGKGVDLDSVSRDPTFDPVRNHLSKEQIEAVNDRGDIPLSFCFTDAKEKSILPTNIKLVRKNTLTSTQEAGLVAHHAGLMVQHWGSKKYHADGTPKHDIFDTRREEALSALDTANKNYEIAKSVRKGVRAQVAPTATAKVIPFTPRAKSTAPSKLLAGLMGGIGKEHPTGRKLDEKAA